MATIQEQLESSVNSLTENSNKLNDFIHGNEEVIIETSSGNKPTMAKVIKDINESVNSSIDFLTDAVNQVSEDKVNINQVKTDVNKTKDDVEAMFNSADLPGLNQKITDNAENIIITDDENIFTNYHEYGWKGRITSESKSILSSDTELKAYGIFSYGNPIYDSVNTRISCPTGDDVVGVAYKANTYDMGSVTDFEYYGDFEFLDVENNNYQLFSLGGMPNTDRYGLLVRMYSGQLRVWASSNGTSWDITSDSLGIKTDFSNGRYQFKLVKSSADGSYKLYWSNDGKNCQDETKEWTIDLVVNSLENIYGNPGTVLVIGFGADCWDYVVSGRFPPEYVYNSNCGFIDKTSTPKEMANNHMKSGFIFKQVSEFHQYVGYKDNDLILELCSEYDGSDLMNINGDKAYVFGGYTRSESITYDFIKYTDEGNIRYFKTHPKFTISNTTSTTAGTYNLLHYTPKNAHSFNCYFYTNGGYQFIRDTNIDNTKFYGYKEQSISYSNQTDRKVSNIILSDKTGKIWLDRDSYDSNSISLYSQGHSLKRGVKQ